MMRRRMTLRIAGILALCLLAGSAFLAAGPPAGPLGPPPPTTPPPPPPEPPPPPPLYPCISILPPVLLASVASDMKQDLKDIGDIARWTEAGPFYESGPFKTFINPEFQGINALLKFDQLQKGAYIGILQAAAKFRFAYKGGEKCPPPPVGPAHSLDEGSYLLWMAHAPTLGCRLPPELITMNWFMAIVSYEIGADGKIDMRDI